MAQPAFHGHCFQSNGDVNGNGESTPASDMFAANIRLRASAGRPVSLSTFVEAGREASLISAAAFRRWAFDFAATSAATRRRFRQPAVRARITGRQAVA